MTEKKCQECGNVFRGDYRQIFCRHKCHWVVRRSGGKKMEPEPKAGPSLINSNNEHFHRDGNGQWWHYVGRKRDQRTRAKIKVCKRCGLQFLTSVYHGRNQGYCSRSCGLKAVCEANPGRYKGS